MKFFLICLLTFIYSCTSQVYSQENKNIQYLPVRVSFSDKVIDKASVMSYSQTMKEFKMDSIKYRTVILFKGNFNKNRIDIYNIGNLDVFNLKQIEYKKYISFENVTTNLSNGSTGNMFFLNNENIDNSFLITLDKKNGFILNNSDKYRFINIYFNDKKQYWHIIYSNYLEINH